MSDAAHTVDEFDLGTLDHAYQDAPDQDAPVPDGRYSVNVDRVELKRSQNSGAKMLEWELRILGPSQAGRKLWKYTLLETPEHMTYRQLIVDLAARFRVPAIYPFRAYVEVAGLMTYGVDIVDTYRRVADMTGEVLRGAKPSDIPFYQQTKYELVLNQKAARSLGLEFPATLLTTADKVIE